MIDQGLLSILATWVDVATYWLLTADWKELEHYFKGSAHSIFIGHVQAHISEN